jgi:superfamily I DNA and/or RNA helicase
VVLLSAHTHLAVDTLIRRLLQYLSPFRQEAVRQGLQFAQIILARVHSSEVPADTDAIRNFPARPCATQVNRWMREGILIIGGTTATILKMAEELSLRQPFVNAGEHFNVDLLVVDEASMMVFPHFLALATLVKPSGAMMLAGDNRQLSPIVAHDWENEDRPPAQHYQPFKSAYDSILRIIEESAVASDAAVQSPLTFTFRLPPIIRDLISRVYRNLDDIELEGFDDEVTAHSDLTMAGEWSDVWRGDNGLILIVHSERSSRQSNQLEAAIIETVLAACPDPVDDSVAIITPHRAQKALLRSSLQAYAETVTIIDTVERLQGGERPTIIVSGTESDPHAIGAAASFILNLNRANVAFSRTQQRLIVVCAETLLDHVPTELEDYESALLWKSLRNLCRRSILATTVATYRVRALAPLLRDDQAA